MNKEVISMKKRVLIVSSFGFPVPAAKGGAVQTLIENLIKENEFHDSLELSIASIYNKDAFNKSLLYKKTNFIYVQKPFLIYQLDKIYEIIYNKIKKKTHKYDKNYIWKIYAILKMINHLIKSNYDFIIFENSQFLLNILKSTKVSRKYENKIFFHIHNDITSDINSILLKKCNIISVSNYLTNQASTISQIDLKNKNYVLKNCIDCSKFSKELTNKDRIELKNNLGIKEDKKILLFVGRLVPEKGILEVVNTAINLIKENCVLLIVGSFNFNSAETSLFEKELHNKCKKYDEYIKFTGYVEYDELWKYYKISDLAILPSKCNEAAGLTMLESLLNEVPLITTKVGGIQEYIKNDWATFVENDHNLENILLKESRKILNSYNLFKENAIKTSKIIKRKYNLSEYYTNFIEILDNNIEKEDLYGDKEK